MSDSVILEAGGIDKAVLLRELVNLVWHGQEERHLLPLRDARLAHVTVKNGIRR